MSSMVSFLAQTLHREKIHTPQQCSQHPPSLLECRLDPILLDYFSSGDGPVDTSRRCGVDKPQLLSIGWREALNSACPSYLHINVSLCTVIRCIEEELPLD